MTSGTGTGALNEFLVVVNLPARDRLCQGIGCPLRVVLHGCSRHPQAGKPVVVVCDMPHFVRQDAPQTRDGLVLEVWMHREENGAPTHRYGGVMTWLGSNGRIDHNFDLWEVRHHRQGSRENVGPDGEEYTLWASRGWHQRTGPQ